MRILSWQFTWGQLHGLIIVDSFCPWLPGTPVIWSFILMAQSTQVPLHKMTVEDCQDQNLYVKLFWMPIINSLVSPGPLIWSSLWNLVNTFERSQVDSGRVRLYVGDQVSFSWFVECERGTWKRTPNVLKKLLPESSPAVIAVFLVRYGDYGIPDCISSRSPVLGLTASRTSKANGNGHDAGPSAQPSQKEQLSLTVLNRLNWSKNAKTCRGFAAEEVSVIGS